MAWTLPETPHANRHEPVLFAANKDALGASFVGGNANAVAGGGDNNLAGETTGTSGNVTGTALKPQRPTVHRPSLSRIILSLETDSAKQRALQVSDLCCHHHTIRKSMYPVHMQFTVNVLSVAPGSVALFQHLLNGLQILSAREAVVAALAPVHGPKTAAADEDGTVHGEGERDSSVPLASPEDPFSSSSPTSGSR